MREIALQATLTRAGLKSPVINPTLTAKTADA